MNILKVTESYTLKGHIWWYMNYISTKLFLKNTQFATEQRCSSWISSIALPTPIHSPSFSALLCSPGSWSYGRHPQASLPCEVIKSLIVQTGTLLRKDDGGKPTLLGKLGVLFLLGSGSCSAGCSPEGYSPRQAMQLPLGFQAPPLVLVHQAQV